MYRNVQAVVVEELRKYAESSKAGDADVKNAVESLERGLDNKTGKRLKIVLAVSVLSMLASFASVVLCALMAAGLIK